MPAAAQTSAGLADPPSQKPAFPSHRPSKKPARQSTSRVASTLVCLLVRPCRHTARPGGFSAAGPRPGWGREMASHRVTNPAMITITGPTMISHTWPNLHQGAAAEGAVPRAELDGMVLTPQKLSCSKQDPRRSCTGSLAALSRHQKHGFLAHMGVRAQGLHIELHGM